MNLKILLAEDDKETSSAIKTVLTNEGYETNVVCNGNDALQLLSSSKNKKSIFDLFIIDFKLPDTTGLEIIDNLQDRGIIIPTILISGCTDKKLITELSKRKFTTFLEKPFRLYDLINSINELILSKEK